MSTVRMYQLIEKANTDLTNDEAQELVGEFENLVYRRFDDRKEMLATKVDLAETEKSLRVDLAETEKRISKEIADVRVDVAEVKVDIGKDINRTYRSLLFWIVIMGILNVIPEILETLFKNL